MVPKASDDVLKGFCAAKAGDDLPQPIFVNKGKGRSILCKVLVVFDELMSFPNVRMPHINYVRTRLEVSSFCQSLNTVFY